jgi:hypothetical protein
MPNERKIDFFITTCFLCNAQNRAANLLQILTSLRAQGAQASSAPLESNPAAGKAMTRMRAHAQTPRAAQIICK